MTYQMFTEEHYLSTDPQLHMAMGLFTGKLPLNKFGLSGDVDTS